MVPDAPIAVRESQVFKLLQYKEMVELHGCIYLLGHALFFPLVLQHQAARSDSSRHQHKCKVQETTHRKFLWNGFCDYRIGMQVPLQRVQHHRINGGSTGTVSKASNASNPSSTSQSCQLSGTSIIAQDAPNGSEAVRDQCTPSAAMDASPQIESARSLHALLEDSKYSCPHSPPMSPTSPPALTPPLPAGMCFAFCRLCMHHVIACTPRENDARYPSFLFSKSDKRNVTC